MNTTVVNVRTGEPFDVYIGRAVHRAKDKSCRGDSLFRNPFRLTSGRSFEEASDLFEMLMRVRLSWGAVQRVPIVVENEFIAEGGGKTGQSPEWWREKLLALDGKRLGCWCVPAPCHGNVLVRLIDELRGRG